MFRLNLKTLITNSFHKFYSPHHHQFGTVKSSLNKVNQQLKSKKMEIKDENDKYSWKRIKFTLIAIGIQFTCLTSYLIYLVGGPEKDSDGNLIEDDLIHYPNWQQYLIRTYRELDRYRLLINQPTREKLLPDPLNYPYLQPKYTLVLELKNVLVYPDWTYNTGWRFKKRPGVDYFLESLNGLYEIVIYTSEYGLTVFPLIEAIDPKNMISYKLVREDTHFYGGQHVKSLDKLNRDLTKVIVIDYDTKNVGFHSENLLKIKKWEGGDDDLSLIDLSNFLQTIAKNDVEDVREVLKFYSKYDDPVEAFRDKQKQLIDYLEKKTMMEKEKDLSKTRPIIRTWFFKNQF